MNSPKQCEIADNPQSDLEVRARDEESQGGGNDEGGSLNISEDDKEQSQSLQILLTNPATQWADLREYMKGRNVCTNAALRAALMAEPPRAALPQPFPMPSPHCSSPHSEGYQRSFLHVLYSPLRVLNGISSYAAIACRRGRFSALPVPVANTKRQNSLGYLKEVVSERAAQGTLQRRCSLVRMVEYEDRQSAERANHVFSNGEWVPSNKTKSNKPWVRAAWEQLHLDDELTKPRSARRPGLEEWRSSSARSVPTATNVRKHDCQRRSRSVCYPSSMPKFDESTFDSLAEDDETTCDSTKPGSNSTTSTNTPHNPWVQAALQKLHLEDEIMESQCASRPRYNQRTSSSRSVQSAPILHESGRTVKKRSRSVCGPLPIPELVELNFDVPKDSPKAGTRSTERRSFSCAGLLCEVRLLLEDEILDDTNRKSSVT